MTYTIDFVAVNGAKLADMMLNDQDRLFSKIRHLMVADGNPDCDINLCLSLVFELCTNTSPADCGDDYFSALWWLCSSVGEQITIPVFTNLRSWDFVEQTGVMGLLSQHCPPFPIPHSHNNTMKVGYIPCRDYAQRDAENIEEEMAKLAGKSLLPRKWNESTIALARQQLAEVVESLAYEDLDLVAIA